EGLVAVAGEKVEQLELAPGEPQGLAVAPGIPPVQIDDDGSEVDLVARLGGLAVLRDAAQVSANAGDPLAGVKWLGHVVVGAHLQANHPVRGVIAGGEQQDGQTMTGTDLPAEAEAVGIREADIEHEQVEFAALQRAARLRSALRCGAEEALRGKD